MPAAPERRVVFLTRNPIIHEAGGSTTLIKNFLELIVSTGMPVTVFVTLAASRSPRVLYRACVNLPKGVDYRAPGYMQIGDRYIRALAIKPWARDLCRLACKRKALKPLSSILTKLFGDSMYCNAWDLTPPTRAEIALVERELAERPVTNVIANYAFWGALFERLRHDRVGKVPRLGIMMHDLLSSRVQAMKAAGSPLDCPELDFATEVTWLNQADYVLAAQKSEAAELRPHTRTEVLIQPIAMPSRQSKSPADSKKVLFVGFNILPNVRGIEFFLDNVWKRVREAVPDATLQIVGSIGSAGLPGFSAPGVEVLGFVDSIDPYYVNAAAVVVPLTFGSGIKIKLLEALSYGKAIVSTTVGVQGVEQFIEDAIAVFDDGPRFAAALIELLKDLELRRARERAADAVVQNWFGESSEPVQAFRRMLEKRAAQR